MEQALMFFKIILPPAAALFFCMLPRTFKNGVFFGVTLTNEQASQQNIKNIVRTYELSTAAAGFILTIVNLYFSLHFQRVIADMASALALVALLIFSVIFYMMAAKATKTFKSRTMNMQTDSAEKSEQPQAAPLSAAFTEGSFCPSPWWYLLHTGVIGFCVLTLYTMYEQITPYVSLWCDFSGNSVFIAQKSIRVLSIPITIQILITLICFYISSKIRRAPLDLKSVRTRLALEKSRKNRALWSVYVCAFALVYDLAAYAYINFMFLLPDYKVFAVIILFAVFTLTLAATLFAAYTSSKNSIL